MLVAERLRKRMEKIHVPDFGSITASFGVASFPAHASSRDTLVVAADRALYNSKDAGRNCASLPESSEPDPSVVSNSGLDLLEALHRL
jgi:GGDEF domain-containing protein